MNRIVRGHVAASSLPEDWREGLAPDALVTVAVDVEAREGEALRPVFNPPFAESGFFSRHFDKAIERYASMDDVVDRVRALRDEWSDRDR